LLSTRQGREAPVGLGEQANAVDGTADGVAVVASERPDEPSARDPARRDELAHRQRRVDAGDRTLREIPEVLRVELHSTRHRFLETEDESQQRRLAAAVRSRDRDELASTDLEGDIAENERAVPVGERDVVESDC
jgi:hypothetical protein